MVNRREKEAEERYEEEGWNSVRNGAPDWLFIKTDEDGNITDVKFVEVKSPTGMVRYEQSIWLRALEFLGADTEVTVIE